jgi:hypothetical protein
LFLLIACLSIQLIAYGNNPPDSINHTLINNSIKCFEEVKVLGSRINKTDSINLELKKKIGNLEFLSDTLLTSNKSLIKINNDNKSVIETKNKWIKSLAYAVTFETILLVILLIK